MLPLDKMKAEAVSTKVLDVARKTVGAKNVWRAIDLIEYDNRLEPAMKHIFGGVLVCTDLDIANKVNLSKLYFPLFAVRYVILFYAHEWNVVMEIMETIFNRLR